MGWFWSVSRYLIPLSLGISSFKWLFGLLFSLPYLGIQSIRSVEHCLWHVVRPDIQSRSYIAGGVFEWVCGTFVELCVSLRKRSKGALSFSVIITSGADAQTPSRYTCWNCCCYVNLGPPLWSSFAYFAPRSIFLSNLSNLCNMICSISSILAFKSRDR